MSITNIDINQLVGKKDAEAQRICGVAHLRAADRAMLRLAQAGFPHVRWKNQVMFYLPALRAHIANQLANQLAGQIAPISGEAQRK